ncbi:MAG: adenylate kinase [Bacteroidetes bacterium]|nr:adenylate kinase [Bacteroidota bacterium]MDA0930854.1 adenylate kinase [Bacteroidota bacterium]
MLNFVFLGPPGSGKGTQSAKLIEDFGFIHLSTGDIFRAELKSGSALGLEAKSYLDSGQLVPDDVVVRMIEQKLDTQAHNAGYIFDGFPRTQVQAQALDALLESKGMPLNHVLLLDVPDAILRERLTERAKTSGRSDDANPEIIEKRIRVYQQETLPLTDYYSKQEKLSRVPGVGHIDEIYARIRIALSI